MDERRTVGLLLMLMALVALELPVQAQPGFNRRSNEPTVARVLMLAPREYQQQLKLAERALEEKQYSEAIEQLGRILHTSPAPDAEGTEDFFIGKPFDNHLQSSLRAQARHLLGAMPAEGRELYELQFGAEARRQLKSALTDSDLGKLSDVSRQYFHTKAGYTATILLGQMYADLGRPLAAAMCFSRLSDAQDARRKYDPELSLLLARSWRMAGMPEKAVEVLQALRQRLPHAQFKVRGKDVSLFGNDEQPLAWLDGVLASPAVGGNRIASEWHMHRGVPSRNAQVDGSLPLLRIRWRVQIANDPDDEALVESLLSNYQEESTASVPTISPIIVDGVLLMKTSDNMMAVDFASGKRIWEYPWSEPLSTSLNEEEPSRPTSDSRRKQLEERLWMDSIYGQMASDGKTLFLIDDLGYTQVSAFGLQVQMIRGMRVENPNQPRDSNTLVALDVRTQGKYRWQVGGINGDDEPKLAGAFFLGPPLVLSEDLYVLAEIRGDVSLFVLDSQTGKVRWSQQLAHVGQVNIMNDPVRRLAGATPSYSDGVLICPTSGGAIVAIDVPNRSLLWGYQYKRSFVTFSRNGIRVNGVFSGSASAGQERWVDATATIAEGRVLVTPPEADELHCLDLLTGRPVWTAKRRDDSLYVACVHQGKAVLVGKRSIIAINLSDGSQAWKLAVGSERDASGVDAVPSGRGFLSGNHYFLPTTLELMQIDVSDGTLVEAVRTERPLGNLLSYRDHIVSLGPDYLTAFYRGDRLKLLVENRLDDNPADPWSIEQRGLLLLDEGRRDEALRLLRQAFDLYPPNDDRREGAKNLLIDTLLDALENDFASNGALASEVNELIDRPLQREKYLRLMGKGLLESGNPGEAFDAYLELAFHQFKSPASSSVRSTELPLLENGSRMHLIRRDRFVRSGIRESLRLANVSQRAQMYAAIDQQLADAMDSDGPGALRQLLSIFGDHVTANQIRLELANRYSENGELLEAEMVLGPLLEDERPEIAAPAWARVAGIMADAEQFSMAADCYRHLLKNWPSQLCLDGKTAEELIAGLPQDGGVARELSSIPRWPYGRVSVEPIKATATNLPTRFQPYANFRPVRVLDHGSQLRPEMQVVFDATSANAIVVNDTLGRERLRIAGTRGRTQRFNDNTLTCKTLGHLLLVNVGQGVLAANILQADLSPAKRIWWPDTYNELLTAASTQRDVRGQASTHTNAWGQDEVKVTGRRISSIGPVSYDGVVYQQGNRLVCVEPTTGETLWMRYDLATDSSLWGDAEYVFVAARNSDQARVFRTLDGEEVGQRPVPEDAQRWTTVGRRVLTWSETTHQGVNSWMLRLYDPWTQQDDWQRAFKAYSKGFVTPDHEVAVVESIDSAGRFTLLDLVDGEVKIEHQLQPFGKMPSEIYLLPSVDQWLLVVGFSPVAVKGVQISSFPDRGMAPLIDAHIYAFDRETGKSQWLVPAIVEGFSLPLNQPANLPVLAFVRQVFRTNTRNRSRPQLSLLCLDKRDGRILMDIDNLNFSYGSFLITGNDADKSVALQLLNVHNYRLQFSHESQPPEPPAQTGSAASRPKGAGLSRVVGAVFGAIGKQVQEQGQRTEKGVIKIIEKQGKQFPFP